MRKTDTEENVFISVSTFNTNAVFFIILIAHTFGEHKKDR